MPPAQAHCRPCIDPHRQAHFTFMLQRGNWLSDFVARLSGDGGQQRGVGAAAAEAAVLEAISGVRGAAPRV